MILDSLDDVPQLNDIIIIGAGPAGISTALQLEKKGIKSIIFEAGGLNFDGNSQLFYKGNTIGDEYPDFTTSRLRQFGGTSGHWGGNCLELDEYDFTGWPITKDDLKLYKALSYKILNIRGNFQKKKFNDNLDYFNLNWSNVRFKTKYFNKIKNSKTISLILNCPVIMMNGENGEVHNIIPRAAVVGIMFIEKEALNAANNMFEDAAVNIIKSLPKMKPAKRDGVPFNKTFQISVEYKIPKLLDYDEIDKAPSFENCVDVEIDESKKCFENYITEHIRKNLKYPKRALKNKIEGDVFIQFEISKDGYFINFTTIGPDKILEDEAYRIMAKLPKVKPGEYLDKKVNVLYGLPISFRL